MRDAAALAGVSKSTLRRWADEERIPSFRTSGGHRRFRVADVRQTLIGTDSRASSVRSAGNLHHAVSQLPTERLEGGGPTRERLALLGRHLRQMTEEYLGRQRSRSAVLAEAQVLGRVYGRELVAARLTLRQSLEAFTLLRRGLEDEGRRHAAGSRPGISADDLRDHLDTLNDRLIAGLAEAYDEQAIKPPALTAGAQQPTRE